MEAQGKRSMASMHLPPPRSCLLALLSPLSYTPSSHLELTGHRELWRGQTQEGIKATAQQHGQD